MILADNYPLLEVFWTMLIFFAFIAWFWMLFAVLGDIFRRHDISGWGKTGWIIFVIVLPFLGVFIYLIAEHDGMTERTIEHQQAAQEQTDRYVRTVAVRRILPSKSPSPKNCSTTARSRRPSSSR
jgi:Phospholipase_D-nuclease N-terminal